jgi:hypothetical protein
MRKSFVILSVLVLAACSPEETQKFGEKMQELVNGKPTDVECKELGFKEGTEAFANCRLQLRISRNQADASRRQSEAMQSEPMRSFNCMNMGGGMTHCQ